MSTGEIPLLVTETTFFVKPGESLNIEGVEGLNSILVDWGVGYVARDKDGFLIDNELGVQLTLDTTHPMHGLTRSMIRDLGEVRCRLSEGSGE